MNAVFDWLRSKRTTQRAADALRAPPDLATALQRSAQLSAQDKASAQTAFELGNRQRVANQPAAAEQHYRQALALHPALAEACANLGSLLKDQGLVADAEPWLALATGLQPKLTPPAL